MTFRFADIVLPLAVRGRFTYAIPEELSGNVVPGVRVLVQFGKKNLYTGIVYSKHNDQPSLHNIRTILRVLDPSPLISETQLRFWQWMSDYYMCTPGEVLKAALPSALSPEGNIDEKVSERYRPKQETMIRLSSGYTDAAMNSILDKLSRAPARNKILSAYLHMTGYSEGSEIEPVSRSMLLKESGSSPAVLDALVKSGILSSFSRDVDRIERSDTPAEPLKGLSESQSVAFNSINSQLKGKNIVLLHGVTSSGKTEIYIHLIEEQLKNGKQVLYLLPEIALTTQIIIRLKKHFGSVTGVYHSRFSVQERAEIWKRVAEGDKVNGYRLILGVRSSLFLPFTNLGLIIVDEEHDGSYKQHDPAPRYHARDSAIVLAGLTGAGIILGSASPSIESYHNAVSGKYGLTELKERYGRVNLPVIVLADTREAYRKKLMVSHFTPQLLEAMDEALARDEQIMLFQNRRGFSPYIECTECGWKPVCYQCAVNLTWHKSAGRLVCHYCGHTAPVPSHCESCGSTSIATRGFGTEKIEDEIKIVFPQAKVGRLDFDTTRSRYSFDRIIRAFEERRVDILTGTQMISKGLDFENLTVVGILNADNMLNFPDFRAYERSFQMMEQVSGRAGRRRKQGKVIIQTSDPSNRIIRMLVQHDYQAMYRMQSEERRSFNYPPFSRMIRINLRHKERPALNHFADIMGKDLRSFFGNRVLGPEFPLVSRVQQWYIKTILLKIEKGRSGARARQYITETLERLGGEKGASSLKIAVDVDPV